MSGRSITDTMFFHLEPGEVSEPLLGPRGFYIAYVRSSTDAMYELNIEDPKHRDYVLDDYARRELAAFAHEVLATSEVEGL